MALINPETKLCDVVINDPSVITVINRFNISLGVGDKNVSEICLSKNIDTDFFLTILNTFINEEYFPEKILKSFSANMIIDYLNKTNDYYQRFQLPNIERHFDLLISRSNSNNNNLELMRKFFVEMKQELLSRIENDRNVWFPEIMSLENEISTAHCDEFRMIYDESENDMIEEKLSDLKNMFVIHLNGEYDLNLCHAVLFAIISFEKDINQNNRIRNRILKPVTKAMKKVTTSKSFK
ncbi:MAG: helix-turn-helix transcriptional regulator [Muribaculaceae bacterium]